jgi:hypothetical protein
MKSLTLFVVFVALVVGPRQFTHAQDSASSQLRAELESMFVSDQALRLEARGVVETFGNNSAENAALWEKQNAIDEANIHKLEEIVQSSGWPRQPTLGGKAAAAAWVVVQHASLAQQQRFLPMLRDAVAKGEAQPQHLALLEDRVRTREGKPQIYGSQIAVEPKTKKRGFHVIEDEANVDKRRAAVGLEPLAEYAKRFGLVYEPPRERSGGAAEPNQPPPANAFN